VTVSEELTMTVGAIVTVEPGTYPATLTNLEDFDYDDGEGKKVLRRWTFALTDELDSDGNPAVLDGVSSLALGPKSKAFGWISALLGRTPDKGEQITRSMLVGKACLVTVVEKDDGYSKIEAVVPAPKKRAAVSSAGGTNTPTAAMPELPPPSDEQLVAATGGGTLDVDEIPF